MKNSAIFIKNENVVTREVAGEVLLVPISGNVANMQHIFTLSPVAQYIWQHIDGKTSVKQLIECITDEFEIDAATAETDCMEFLQSLIVGTLIIERT